MNRIYIFANGGWGRDLIGMALAEDGAPLGDHLSSSEAWLKHDMGVTSTQRHDSYAAHYPEPDGYEVVYVPLDEVETHAGLLAAVEANARLTEHDAIAASRELAGE